jgi:NAD(P)-dependent dehydrogenase (short-subunit alcohol dehydrogenase family)
MEASPLSGQVALVTGAARRIGRSIALELARAGADVVVHYRNSQSEAEATASEIRALSRGVLVLQADVCKRNEVEAMFESIERDWARLDILVNNAATFFHAKFEELSDEQWDSIMATNLKSQFLCAQAAVPLMKSKKQGSGKGPEKGRIVNISSIGGLLAWPGFTHYCVSKAGSIMLTRCLARALAPEILVNSVAPGTIQFDGEIPDEDYIRRVPLHRTGTGNEVAAAVRFLATAEFITGQVLVVDGGRVLV